MRNDKFNCDEYLKLIIGTSPEGEHVRIFASGPSVVMEVTMRSVDPDSGKYIPGKWDRAELWMDADHAKQLAINLNLLADNCINHDQRFLAELAIRAECAKGITKLVEAEKV